MNDNVINNNKVGNITQESAPPLEGSTVTQQQQQQQQQQQHRQQNVAVIIARPPELKSLVEAYLLCIPLGLIGLHHFYLRRYGFGILYFFTFGLCGIGWLVDCFRLPCLVRETNKKLREGGEDLEKVNLTDAYIMWFPLGIIGLHQYYLHRPMWGLAYTFTGGFFLIGWLIDGFRLPSMVKDTNRMLEEKRERGDLYKAELTDAYAFGASPLGIFGAHHFYLRRYDFGAYYANTAGGFLIGWIVDLFRMKILVHRANNPQEHMLGRRHKFLDDAYVMAFPLGFLGLHHFYLERLGWGFLYLFTVGLCGIGWLVDLIRMPCLVRDANARLEEKLLLRRQVQQQLGTTNFDMSHSSCTVHPEHRYAPSNEDRGERNTGGMPSETPVLQPPSYEESIQSQHPTSSNYPQGTYWDKTTGESYNKPPIP